LSSTDSGDDATLRVYALDALALAPANHVARVGTVVRYTLTGTLTDGTQLDLTKRANYSADPGNLAETLEDYGDPGGVRLLAPGTVTVHAWAAGETTTATLTIVP
jgi:hypothetical protein